MLADNKNNSHKTNEVTKEQLAHLSEVAWQYRENAFLFGKTKVGVAILAEDGAVFGGCNIEHEFRSHDIHAETCGIANMVASGRTKMTAILVVAERTMFTPCGSCLEWIMQFGGPDCRVYFQSSPTAEFVSWSASDLMPYHDAFRV